MATKNKPDHELGLNNYRSDLQMNQMVLRQESFGRLSEGEQSSAVHIAFGVDQNFVRGMGVAMVSILANNPLLSFVFHICTKQIHSEDLFRIEKITKKHPVLIIIYWIQDRIFANLATFEHLSSAIYYRIVLADLLAERINRLLYLDADIICQGRLDELLNINLSDAVACVVAEDHLDRVEWLQLKQGRYFNSGMLYLDLEKWGRDNYSERVLACLGQNRDRFTLPDQDALNVVLDGKVKFLDSRWNYFYDMGRQTGEIPANTIFVHFFGAIKPWEILCNHPMQRHYQKYEQQSPWADEPLMNPISASKMEQYARQLWLQGARKNSVLWYGKYLVGKFL